MAWRFMVLALVPLLGAWTGHGSGAGRLTRGEGAVDKAVPEATRTVTLETVVSVRQGDDAQLVATIELPGESGDAVLTLALDWSALYASELTLPSPLADVRYSEYDGDGDTRFHAVRKTGRLRIGAVGAGRFDLALDLLLFADTAGKGEWRRLSSAGLSHDVVNEDDDGDGDEGSDESYTEGSIIVSDNGCSGSSSSYDDDNDYSNYDGDSGGCEGDDVDATETDGGGCAGDGAAEGTEGVASCAEGCSGDAVASVDGRVRRSPLLARLVAWLPWLSVFLVIRLMRGGLRLRVRGRR